MVSLALQAAEAAGGLLRKSVSGKMSVFLEVAASCMDENDCCLTDGLVAASTPPPHVSVQHRMTNTNTTATDERAGHDGQPARDVDMKAHKLQTQAKAHIIM
eukprot:scaffold246232_cov37-Prasinocladus_malaysianus.AAC.2